MKNNNLQREIGWLLKEKHSGQLTNKAKKDIIRLKKGEPVDYVIGFTEFLGCKIDLSYKPLIPRVETEFWVNFIFRQNNFSNSKVLDMFSGSGCIGLAVLKNFKNSKVVFADNNKNAILQIKKNIEINNGHIRTNMGYTKNKICVVIKSDIFKNLNIKKYKNYFNFILVNPPYISIINKSKIQKSTLKYEPKIALFGGQDGLYFIKKFLQQAKNYLTENGVIYMEFDGSAIQKSKIEKMLKSFSYKIWQFHKDQFDKYRYVEIKL